MKMNAKKVEVDDLTAFGSEIEDDDGEADVESEFSPTLTKLSLEEENEILKEENELLKLDLRLLKKEVVRLRKREAKSLPRDEALNQKPASLRQVAANNSLRRPRPSHNPQYRKLSGTALNDFDDTVGAVPDLEMHPGLVHRHHPHSPKRSPLNRDSSLKLSFFADGDDESGLEPDDEESVDFLLADLSGVSDSEIEGEDEVVIVVPESFWAMVQDRAGWLVGLLVLQSMSSFILARNEKLLQEHVIIVRFLTMLVGAGGNAGNQASVRGTLRRARPS
jgi:hypothetical protein